MSWDVPPSPLEAENSVWNGARGPLKILHDPPGGLPGEFPSCRDDFRRAGRISVVPGEAGGFAAAPNQTAATTRLSARARRRPHAPERTWRAPRPPRGSRRWLAQLSVLPELASSAGVCDALASSLSNPSKTLNRNTRAKIFLFPTQKPACPMPGKRRRVRPDSYIIVLPAMAVAVLGAPSEARARRQNISRDPSARRARMIAGCCPWCFVGFNFSNASALNTLDVSQMGSF